MAAASRGANKMIETSSVETQAAREQLLAQLLAELTEERRLGRQPDLDRVAAQHPAVARELRELWAVVQLAQNVAQPAAPPVPTIHLRATSPGSAGPDGASGLALPRKFGDYELHEALGRAERGGVSKARHPVPHR